MNHVEKLYTILESAPEDWDTRGVLADAMEEAGNESGAEGQRWMIENREHAKKSTAAGREDVKWFWHRRKGSELDEIKTALASESREHIEFATLIDADRWLANKLAEPARPLWYCIDNAHHSWVLGIAKGTVIAEAIARVWRQPNGSWAISVSGLGIHNDSEPTSDYAMATARRLCQKTDLIDSDLPAK